jgi:Outer membrane protein beta-barrel domain
VRKLAFLVTAFAFFALSNPASAQQGDAAIGFGTLLAPGAAPCGYSGSSGGFACPEKGGLYPTIGGDAIFHKRFGIGGDITWRGGQGNYAGLGIPYRPIIFDINGVYQPRLGKKVGLDLLGGIGWQTTRFYGYNNSTSCIYFSACYNSHNHFLLDVGAGIRYYVWGHVFLRPEVRYYHIVNNTDVFTSSDIVRVGASIGYTIGPD